MVAASSLTSSDIAEVMPSHFGHQKQPSKAYLMLKEERCRKGAWELNSPTDSVFSVSVRSEVRRRSSDVRYNNAEFHVPANAKAISGMQSAGKSEKI